MLKHSPVGSLPILFHARWVSGFIRSPQGVFRFPSASRCLEVILTDEELRIRMLPPISFMLDAQQSGYKKSIPLSRVVQIEETRFLGWWHTARVTFTTDTHQQMCLELGFKGLLPQIGSGQLRRRNCFVQILRESLRKVQQ